MYPRPMTVLTGPPPVKYPVTPPTVVTSKPPAKKRRGRLGA